MQFIFLLKITAELFGSQPDSRVRGELVCACPRGSTARTRVCRDAEGIRKAGEQCGGSACTSSK